MHRGLYAFPGDADHQRTDSSQQQSEVKTSEKPRVIRLSIVILTGVKKEYIPKKE